MPIDQFSHMTPVEQEKSTIQRETPSLIPARMLNEFAYCPRLAYLEWVDGEFADNLDTVDGRFGHRRVDKESRQSVPAAADVTPEQETIHTRSLMLSAPNEGFVAKTDLIEISGTKVTPVDYKRGRVPDNPEQSWEPERVQLCVQGLILRELGYECDEGVLYYIESRRRVTIVFDDALILRTRELAVRFRETAALGEIPPPLVDSPKCPRCSLVGICLPDETNFLSTIGECTALSKDGPATDSGTAIRLLTPSLEEALPVYVQEQGGMVGKSGDCLEVKVRGKENRRVPLRKLSQLCLFGNVQISAQALRELTSRGVPICHFSYGGWFHGITSGLMSKNIELRIRQFEMAASAANSLPLAKSFIMGKIKNSRTLLRRHLPKSEKSLLTQLSDSLHKVKRVASAESLLGIEGTAAKLYFAGYSQLVKPGLAFTLEGRSRRPPTDPINAMLSFLYSILAKEMTITLQSVGFDPMLGFFHAPRYGRPSLALDLCEEFRTLLVDSTVLSLVNTREIEADHFLTRAGAVTMTDAGRRTVLAAFERRLSTEVRHPLFGYTVSYRRCLEVQARLLARVLTGEIVNYPFFETR